MSGSFDEEAISEGMSTPFHGTPVSLGDPILQWSDLTYEVKTKAGKPTEWKTIMSKGTGVACTGETIAIIGSSGAGKTTLLNALSGRTEGGRLSGSILYHGAKRHPGSFKRTTAYVQQDDLMHPLLTVHETLTYAAKLRLPNSQYSEQEKQERVQSVMRHLRLNGAKDTPIGDAKTRGVSGGERKRVSVGMELLTSPRLLFLDEPTSGLDSNSSQLVVELVKGISKDRGIATLVTIHQPSARIFNLFDKVILLSQGRVVYFGPVSESIQYFAKIGHQCPVHENPADYFVNIMTLDYRSDATLAESKKQIAALADTFARHVAEPNASLAEKQSLVRSYGEQDTSQVVVKNGWLYEYATLANRDWTNTLRNIPFIIGQIVQAIFMGVLIGFMYFYLKDDSLSVMNRMGVLFIITVMTTFPVVMPMMSLYVDERDIMVRERASATFRISSFYVSKATIFLPIALVSNTIMFVGIYFIAHLAFDVAKFFIALAIFYGVIMVSIAFTLMIGSAVETMEMGAMIAPAVLTIQLLFGGLLSNPSTITPVLRWICWVNPVFHTFAALAQNELGGLTFTCPPGTQCYATGEQVLMSYSLMRFNVWQSVLFMIMLGAVNYAIGYVFLRWKAKPKYLWL
ncbi:hypothetical protein FBU59_002455 [Linderina macrospora]|uniref:Uncharacterized protein n=1 Tax=Linderina macrospora TaxID=4868 RepID=A0ACC1JB99_9FUNG|nr:hypothetical protein FBU59_002455 [Linderina macrospora]